MPEKRKNQTQKKNIEKPKKPSNDAVEHVDRPIHQILPYIIGATSVFLLFCFVAVKLTGFIGVGLRWFFNGLFGGASLVLPFLSFVLALFWRKQLRKSVGALVRFAIWQSVFFVFLSSLIHIWSNGSMTFNPITLFAQGLDRQGCGALGGLLGVCIYKLTGPVGVHIIGLSAVLIFGLLMFGLTPYSIYLYIRYFIHESREKSKRKNLEKENEERVTTFKQKSKPTVIPEEEENNYATVKPDPYDRHHFEPDVDIDGTGKKESGKRLPENESESTPVREDLYAAYEEEDKQSSDATAKTETVAPTRVVKKSVPDFENGGDKADLQGIFGDGANMEVINRFADEHERKNLEKSLESSDASIEITRTPVEEEPVEKKEYQFPPIALLKIDKTPKNENIRDELQTNATRLVETLKSFKVRTRIVNVSRGPAITRYELAPEEGVRVRQIANLVDDIALNLATTGVRVEAPIPGKAAVGIEVPNKTVSTVYLRELIETETFAKATSKLNVCLGIDVAGEPVFLDIAKMPHLLIAGATGMGKSVCINSIITSLLYKGTPDEIKLILIDPKKVELNIYNGLPHLLVPVVSDPKKAAGTLQWAVTEMERRFELIEEVGVRDVKNYNIVTKDDPEKEFLPQIVIIIDELADLMMTAPDDVEASICRLAQKARAAGMHIIIGTQRPSVDVITGLIKANVPSRIACTVASQTDSRVILDMAGAEKLIGRGDMLYAPVGAPKPRRVQGAFVSEGEVESVVTFIKEENGDVSEYNSDIIASIDRAAASCGSGKKGGSSGGFGATDDASSEGGDPMLRAAIELALESDKISTSLIQRRLSLGYGRAAKLIDEMEKRGYVSAPEGQKPRRVLITREQYMEMVINRSEELQ